MVLFDVCQENNVVRENRSRQYGAVERGRDQHRVRCGRGASVSSARVACFVAAVLETLPCVVEELEEAHGDAQGEVAEDDIEEDG